MTLRLQTLLTGLIALLMAALLACAPAGAKGAAEKSVSGGYQLFAASALGDQHAIQLASLENFDYHAKTASECCNAPKGGLTKSEIADAGLPELPSGYHYRSVGGETQVVRNPGQAGNLPPMHLENGKLVPGSKPGVVRNTATRSAFLKDLAGSDKIPSNIKPWLEQGKVPPGYTVHHKKALFDGGTDTTDNMVLQGVDLHTNTHKFYRPGGKVPSIEPSQVNPY